MKTAVIYARYSSDSQTEQSIDGQLRVCEEYAKKNNILIVQTYIDRAMTGTNDKRPDFQQMLKDSYKKQWDYVLVYKLDRFSRNKYESVVHKKTLKENGVKLISAMENIPDSPEGIILESLLEGMNQYYSAELAQKIKRGMHECRIKGNYQGGGVPYGYKVVNKKLIIDEDKSEIVKYIFEQYSLGVYVRDISRNLADKGIYNKGKPFAINTIYNILKNEKYLGVYKHNEEIIDNMYPKIIEKDLFEKIRVKTKKNNVGAKSVRTRFLLREKLTCAYCGYPISAESSTSKTKKIFYYYKCSGRKHHFNGCIKTTIRKEVLEEFVIDLIISELSKPKVLDLMIDKILETQNKEDNNLMLKSMEKEKRQLESSLNNIMNAIEQGIINKTTNKRMKEIEDSIEDLECKILIEKAKFNTQLTKDECKLYYIEALKKEPMLLINSVIKNITMSNDSIEITFNNLNKKSPDNQGSSFYSTYKHCGVILNIDYAEIKFYI